MSRSTKKVFKIVGLVAMGVVLMVAGLVCAVYSSWFQRAVREALVEAMNSKPGTQFALKDFQIDFPLHVTFEGLLMVQNGDTMLRADTFDADVKLLPLLGGDVDVKDARASNARYQLGTRDSATCIVIDAAQLRIDPASVRLSPMHIDITHATMADGVVDIFINPCPPPSPQKKEDASPLTIDAQTLDLHNFVYRMNMMPTIDSLGAHIEYARLSRGHIDLLAQQIGVKEFSGHGLTATYLVPDSAAIKDTEVCVDTTAHSASWTVRVDKIDFDSVAALYTMRDYRPLPGMDFGYIQVFKARLSVENFYNRGPEVILPLKLSGVERCGVDIDLAGTLKVSETRLNFDNLRLTTSAGTKLDATGMMGIGNPIEDAALPLSITASGAAACRDLGLMFPMMQAYFVGLPNGSFVDVDMDVRGSMAKLDIERMYFTVDGSMMLDASGELADVLYPERMTGEVRLSGKIGDMANLQKVLAPDLADVVIAPLTLDGQVKFGRASYVGSVEVQSGNGLLALDGEFHGNAESYDLVLSANEFPLHAFMPKLGVGAISADITAVGQGLNVFNSRTVADVDIDIAHLVFNGHNLRDIKGVVNLSEGRASIDFDSRNSVADLSLHGEGTLVGESYDWDVNFYSRRLDMFSLGLSDAPMGIVGKAELSAQINAKRYTLLSATMDIPSLVYTDSLGPLRINDVHARLSATENVTNLSLSNGDLYAFFSAPQSLDSLMVYPEGMGRVLQSQYEQRRIDIDQLQDALPQFSFNIDGGNNNMLANYLAQSGMIVRNFAIEAINDSIFTLDSRATNLRMGETKMDTLTFNVAQDGNRLNYKGRLRNRPGTLDLWAAVDVDGYFRPGRLGMDFHQRDISGQSGFRFGAYADLSPDSTITMHIDPLTPTIGYRNWLVNQDNFIRYDFASKHIDANLRMYSEDSSLDLYTEHASESHDDGAHNDSENLIVRLKNIRIQDWITLNPFAPAIKGNISTDLKLNYHDGRLMANGELALGDLYYGREKVGDFRSDVDVKTSPGGVINANLGLWVNGKKSVTLSGSLNDSTQSSPFRLDMTMIHLPLSTVNPFVPGLAKLQGLLNGRMDVSGDMSAPRLDGYMQFDSASVFVDMLGTTFSFSPDTIPVETSRMRLKKFAVTACNENPLYVDGEVNIRSLADIGMDLSMRANDMQIVNSARAAKRAEVYGKAFVNVDATAKGSLAALDINAKLQLNSGTNVTYIMPDAESVIQNRGSDDMVRFVNFNDTLGLDVDSIAKSTMALKLDALLTIASGTTINVDLDSKGKNKVQLQSQGTLNYTLSPMSEEGRLTGRLNINSGFVRYTPPLMSEKLFNFEENSYLAFSGDMLNPALNIRAVDKVRANVTRQGQNSHLVDFDVSLAVTGTLNNMNVVFDLATNGDVTIANELQSMSPTQRASEAMNLLLYNVYTGPGTKANANLSGNPLYSFLSSQLNSWAANTIKGVDLSFGIDQYNRTNEGVSQQTTSYSYRVSKSLFNDRFKIAVGGNYSTDVDADQNLANNLFNDISLEYTLNKSGTMYVKIFRHTGFESILEGEITQTGVGFVYKRKIRRLSDMFRLRRRRRLQQTVFQPESENATVPIDTTGAIILVTPTDTINETEPVDLSNPKPSIEDVEK